MIFPQFRFDQQPNRDIEDVKNQMVAVVGKIVGGRETVEENIADVKTKSDMALFVLAMRKEPEKHAEKIHGLKYTSEVLLKTSLLIWRRRRISVKKRRITSKKRRSSCEKRRGSCEKRRGSCEKSFSSCDLEMPD